MHGAEGVEIIAFVRADGERVPWPGRVFLDASEQFVFSRGGRLGDRPAETQEETRTVPADSVAAIVVRNEFGTAVVVVGVCTIGLAGLIYWGIRTAFAY